MKIIPDLGIQIPQVYLPKPGTDLTKWAVMACDQFTSQREYWNEVEKIVGDAPSTLNLTFPEVYLEKPGGDERIRDIQTNMRKYMDEGIIQPHDELIFVERTVGGRTRKGIVLALDLEAYDYNKGSSSLIRATEGTIVDRLPPRIKIREGALLELPHLLVLIDDPTRAVIEPLRFAAKSGLEKRYDFELMLDSGHLAGYALDQKLEDQVVEALRGLMKPETFASKYGIDKNQPVLLFAMGDGNHYLLAAIIDPANALPGNPAGVAQLNTELTALMKSPPSLPVAQLPETARAISSKTYVFKPNSANVETLRLEFDDTAQAIMYLRRLGSDVIWRIGLDNTYRLSSDGLELRGYWEDSQTFIIEVFDIGLTTRRLYFTEDCILIGSPGAGIEGCTEDP